MKKFSIVNFLAINLLLISFLSAQSTPEIEWDKTFGDKKNEIGLSIIQNSDYDFVFTSSKSRGFVNHLVLNVTDGQGNKKIEKKMKNYFVQNTFGIVQTKDKGYATIGSSNSYEGSNLTLIKIDPNLNQRWFKNYSFNETNIGATLVNTHDNGFAILCNSGDFDNNFDIVLLKTDSKGNKQWEKTFPGDSIDYGFSLAQTTDKGFIIAGYTHSFGNGMNDFYLIRTDKNGNTLWDKTYGGVSGEQATAVKQTEDGGFIVVGTTFSKGSGWGDIWLIKTNKDGNIMWEKTIGGSKNDEAQDIIIENDGYVIAGNTKSKGLGEWDFWIIKTDFKGNIIWDKTFGGFFDDKVFSFTKTFDDGYALAGYTKSKGNGRKDAWIVKLKFSIRDRAENFVESEINDWQQKGKYEKLADYKKRVTIHTRKQKINELTNKFFGKIGDPIFKKDIINAKLDYDTESEVFKISMNYFNPMYVPVPIEQAPNFDKNFNKLVFSDLRYSLTNEDKLEIYQATIKNPMNGKTYFYDASKAIVFKSLTIENKFKPIEINPQKTNNPDIDDQTNVIVGESDVDVNIPETGKTYPNRYALIIGNGNYIEHGSDMVDIKYSINDAKIFKKYAIKVLGVPDNSNNIYYIEDANATYIKLYIDNFVKLIKSKPKGSEFFIFYSGHGTQNEQKESFIVPVGVKSDYIEDFGIKLSDLYAQISPGKDKKVFVFIDACFSGGGKSGQFLVNAKTGLYRPQKDADIGSNIVVFAASSEKQISQEFLEKQHGLFTYFLLKTLKETKGEITYGELFNKIKDNVNTTTLNPQNNLKEQIPKVNVNPAIQNSWKNWRIHK